MFIRIIFMLVLTSSVFAQETDSVKNTMRRHRLFLHTGGGTTLGLSYVHFVSDKINPRILIQNGSDHIVSIGNLCNMLYLSDLSVYNHIGLEVSETTGRGVAFGMGYIYSFSRHFGFTMEGDIIFSSQTFVEVNRIKLRGGVGYIF